MVLFKGVPKSALKVITIISHASRAKKMAKYIESGPNQKLRRLIDHSPLATADRESCYSICHSILSSEIQASSREAAVAVLESIPLGHEPSCIPLACLSSTLRIVSAPWLSSDVIRCYSKLWHALPDDVKSGHDRKLSAFVGLVLDQVKETYRTLADLLHSKSRKPALSRPLQSGSISHGDLYRFIDSFSLPISSNDDEKSTVAIGIPNGHLLALACLAVATYFTAVPLNATGGAEQFRNDVLQTHSKVVLACRSDIGRLGLDGSWAVEAGVGVIVVDERLDMTFDLSPLKKAPQMTKFFRKPNSPDDTVFILNTSGTSGGKKTVPLSLQDLVSGVAFVIESWKLTEGDVCLNMMPLNHM